MIKLHACSLSQSNLSQELYLHWDTFKLGRLPIQFTKNMLYHPGRMSAYISDMRPVVASGK